MSESDKSIAKDEADDNCGIDEYTAPLPLLGGPKEKKKKGKKKKKRYVPPHPDSDTFPTQQAFLDSLKPTSIDEIDEDFRKCPICWKLYGEAADPGHDNTEEPVRLRCNHVFGDKCLAYTFALPDTSQAEFRSLSFTPTSRGSALGLKLHAFIIKYNSKNNSKNSGYDAETFVKMLEESDQPKKGQELFGDYWWPIFRELRDRNGDMDDVTFFENAVVLDYKPARPKEDVSNYSSFDDWFTASSTDMDQTPFGTIAEFMSSSSSSESLPVLDSPIAWEQPLSSSLPIKGPPPLEAHHATNHAALPMQSSLTPLSTEKATVPPQGSTQSTPMTVLQQFSAAAVAEATELKNQLLALEKQAKCLYDPLDAQKKKALTNKANFDEYRRRAKRLQGKLHGVGWNIQTLLSTFTS